MNNIEGFESQLLKVDLYSINAKKYAEKIKDKSTVVIWGSSSAGQLVYDFLTEFNVLENVKYFADNDSSKWGAIVNGMAILSPEEVMQKILDDPSIYIILASLHLVDIQKQLRSLGVHESSIDMKGLGVAKDYFTFKEETPYEIIYSHFNEYERVFSYLSDERSKSIYLGILNSKISLDNVFLIGISSPPEEQYFDYEIIKLMENEVFCDCGSYNGDTLDTFIKVSNGKYKKYIALEADKGSFAELNKKISISGYLNVDTHNVACWNKKTVLKFTSAKTAGHINEIGDITVCADTLDNVLYNEKITFLKMDIEGAEEMALLGAADLIKKSKPILAICLYHRLEDFYKLPLIMKNLNSEYRLFIRHYTDMADAETVCYAIPEHRSVL